MVVVYDSFPLCHMLNSWPHAKALGNFELLLTNKYWEGCAQLYSYEWELQETEKQLYNCDNRFEVMGVAQLNKPHMVTMLQLVSWPMRDLPNATAVLSLLDQLTNAEIKSSAK